MTGLSYAQVRTVVMCYYPSVRWEEISQKLSFGVDGVSSHMVFVAVGDDGMPVSHLMDIAEWNSTRVPRNVLLDYIANKLAEKLNVGKR